MFLIILYIFDRFLESGVWDYCASSDFCKIGTETIAASRPTQNTSKTIKDSKRKRAIANQRVKTGEEQPWLTYERNITYLL